MKTLDLKFEDITGETRRVYTFANGQKVTIEDVIAVCVRPSGNHRLITRGGLKYIIPAGWLALELHASEWSL
jgi:hypothetical protein